MQLVARAEKFAPRHSESNGDVEQHNSRTEEKLNTWMVKSK